MNKISWNTKENKMTIDTTRRESNDHHGQLAKLRQDGEGTELYRRIQTTTDHG